MRAFFFTYFSINKRNIFLIALTFIALINTSTIQAQEPTITGFDPTTACQGDNVTITGTNFKDVSTVRIGNVNAASFTVQNATTIKAVIAANATTGIISVTTPDGTANTTEKITINPAPVPELKDISTADIPFTNCDGSATYQLIVQNISKPAGGACNYDLDWGDGSPHFTQADWPVNSQINHTYNSQGYFKIKLTITPTNGCTKTQTYNFYNGANPIASLSTTTSTTGLCAPAIIDFKIGNWYNNSAGTTYELDFGDKTQKQTLSHPLNTTNTEQIVAHEYTTSSCPSVDFTATLKAINGCYTTTYTLNQIVIRIKPVADFDALPAPACAGGQVCFTNKTTNGYTGTSCNTTTAFTWDFGDGTPVSTQQTPPCHIYATAGSYQVTLTASNTGCGSDTKTKTIVVNPLSPVPVITTPVTYCQKQPTAPLTATGTGLLWYTTATGGTGSPNAPTPSSIYAGNTTYYVTQTQPDHCESPRVPIIVTVNATPLPPVVTPSVALCQNQPESPLSATGVGLLWYDVATGGTGSAIPPTPSTALTGSTTYYVSQTINNCEGPRASINVTVNPLPVQPAVNSPVTYCQNQPAFPLTASGTNLLWYTSATGGVGSAIAPTPSTIIPGNTTYYVSQATDCGESPRAAITVIVNASPTASIAYNPTTFCNTLDATGNPPVDVTLTGNGGGFYTITPSGLPIDANTGTISPSGATAGNYTIKYTIPGKGGCSDFITTTSVTVQAAPSATIAYRAICSSDAFVDVQLTGTKGGTFTSTPGLTIDGLTGRITPGTSTPGSYTVTYTIAATPPCNGFTTKANVTITKAESAAISYSKATLCNVDNTAATPNPDITVTIMGSTSGVFSVSPAGLPINAQTGTITPAGTAAGTYTIKYTIAGAGGCTDFTTTTSVTITEAPFASISYAPICSSDATASVQFAGTPGGIFASTPGLTIDASTGSINPAASTPGTYEITYTIAESLPCPGFQAKTTVTITKAPSATIAYQPTVLCNVTDAASTPNPPVNVSFTGSTGGTYSISPTVGLHINTTTGTITPSGATAGMYTIKYTVVGSGGCLDYSTTTSVTINSAPMATISYAAKSFCNAINTLQPILISGTGGGLFSAAQGLSINTATGEINPALSKPGTYQVTYTIAASAPCPGFITTTIIGIDESPVITFAATEQSVCSGETAVFKPSSSLVNTFYKWSVVGALPPGVSGTTTGSSSGPNATISVSFINTTTISQTIHIQVTPTNPTQNPCTGSTYDLVLHVNPIPAILTSDTTAFCMHTTATPLTTDALPGNTVKWYNENGVLLNAAPVADTKTPATFVYYATQTNSYGCESPKAKFIAIVHPTARITSSSYTNPTTCGIASGSIILNVVDLNGDPIPSIPVTVHYTKFQADYTMAASTDASGKIIIALVAGTYSNIYVETYGCLSQKIPDVFVLKDPSPPAGPIAGYNEPLCSGTVMNLSASSATSSQTGAVNYVWVGPAFGNTADTTQNTVITFPLANTAYNGTYIVYAIQNNCISTATTFQVDVKLSPAIPKISTRTPLCTGDNLTLQASSSIPGNNTLTYTWSGPAAGMPVSGAYATINNIQVKDAGVYTVTVTSPQTGCSASADTLIQVGGYPVVKFTQDSITVPTGSILTLSPLITNSTDPNILPIKKYEWTPSQLLACNDQLCSAPKATIKDNVCYTVKATNIYGCSGSDTICVKAFCQNSQVFIPNAFTPRGGLPENARFMVRSSGIASVKSFRVFNRWGRLVFERNNFSPNNPDFGWDGMINGKPADTGVYVYTVEVICENGVPYFFKGNVTLL